MSEEIVKADELKQELAKANAELALQKPQEAQLFELAQRKAQLFSQSQIVPVAFQGKVADCFIAIEMAGRMGAGEMAVMQNLHIIHGKPGWSATFIIASINASGRFSPLRYEFVGTVGKDDWGCRAWAYDLSNNEKLIGTLITIGIAKKEGWYSKNGSKWQSIPELMLQYRAATFFGRAYAPELLMGLQTNDELNDVGPMKNITPVAIFDDIPAITEPPETAEVEPEPEPEKKPEPKLLAEKKKEKPVVEKKPEPKEDAPATTPEPEKEDSPKAEPLAESKTDWDDDQVSLPDTPNMPQMIKLLEDNKLFNKQLISWAKENGHDLNSNDFVVKAVNSFGRIQDAIAKF